MLEFETNKLMKDYVSIFKKELRTALKQWEEEVKQHYLSKFIKEHGNPKVKAKIENSISSFKKSIIVYFEANPAALADSFGTGSLMDERFNPIFEDYWNDIGSRQGQRNPARRSRNIEGRPRGEYTNIFGEKRWSSGYMAGENLEYLPQYTGWSIQPIPPSNAIEQANFRFYNTYLRQAYENTLRQINFSKYLIEVDK